MNRITFGPSMIALALAPLLATPSLAQSPVGTASTHHRAAQRVRTKNFESTVRVGPQPAAALVTPRNAGLPRPRPTLRPTGDSSPLPVALSTPITPSTHGVIASFDGLSSVGSTARVPDQGLCVGAGYVVEVINRQLRVYDQGGSPLADAQDMRAFFDYPEDTEALLFDPTCLYDRTVERWFVLNTAIVSSEQSVFNLAVSVGPSPLGAWRIYRLPTDSDGTDGSPVHPNCPCFQDYPHMAVDTYGLHISSSEKSTELGNNGPINGPQIFSVSKRALAQGAAAPMVVQLGSISFGPEAGFGLWPALATGSHYAAERHGTQYFMQSVMNFLAPPQSSTSMGLVAVSNTRSLDDAVPALELRQTTLEVPLAVLPQPATQKVGDFPLGECLNDPVCSDTVIEGGPFSEVEEQLDNFSHVEVAYAHGRLWSVLSTALEVAGEEHSGVLWMILRPQITAAGLSAQVQRHGYLAIAGNELIYPTIAVLDEGRGVIGFSLSGPEHYPSFGWTPIHPGGTGLIRVAAPGAGPLDDRSGYAALISTPTAPVSRFGDYGAAVSDGHRLWIAGEYVNQTCTLAAYMVDNSCGDTRHRLSNFATRIVGLSP